ncbi:hypothetical protein, conserved [Eimeria praecox]|uniref:Transmembrane protein n=1 Tax=Eimeria praecox TaxID=51316 RepID=U6G2S9_9EIME|nr:hypothetical protein, conserved [Eimeria praecox]
MQGRYALGVLLLLGSAACSAAEPAAVLDELGFSGKEATPSHTQEVEERAEEEPVTSPEARLIMLFRDAASAIDNASANGTLPLKPPAPQGPEAENAVTAVQPGQVGAPISTVFTNQARGRGLLLFGTFMLVIGVVLSLGGNRPSARVQPSSMDVTLQKTLELMDTLGVKSASNLAVGCIIAGLIELYRSLNGGQNSPQPGQAAQPPVRGRMLLVLAFGALLASLSMAGVDISNLNVSEFMRVLIQYISKAHLGLFAAGGAAFVKSLYEVMEHQQQQQQQSGTSLQQGTTGAPADEKQPTSAEVVGDLTAAPSAESNEKPEKNGVDEIITASQTPSGEPSLVQGSSSGEQAKPVAGAQAETKQETPIPTEEVPDKDIRGEGTTQEASVSQEAAKDAVGGQADSDQNDAMERHADNAAPAEAGSTVAAEVHMPAPQESHEHVQQEPELQKGAPDDN